jgi:methyl-accepting chemotaxis protein
VSRVEGGAQLVDEAGRKMEQIVESIRGVNEIVADIQRASAEQSSSVQQVGRIVGADGPRARSRTPLLVEQAAAAAQSLNHQAQELADAVAVFRLTAA